MWLIFFCLIVFVYAKQYLYNARVLKSNYNQKHTPRIDMFCFTEYVFWYNLLSFDTKQPIKTFNYIFCNQIVQPHYCLYLMSKCVHTLLSSIWINPESIINLRMEIRLQSFPALVFVYFLMQRHWFP